MKREEEVKEFKRNMNDGSFCVSDEIVNDIIDQTIEWADQHPKNVWKNPEYDLPEYDKPVIGIFKDGSICECKCSPEERIWFIDILVCDEPILWINKPELPK